MDHGNRQPLGTLRRLDSISILPLVLLELHTVQKNEMVSLVHLVEVSEPGHELSLVDGDDHRDDGPWIKIGFDVNMEVRVRAIRR